MEFYKGCHLDRDFQGTPVSPYFSFRPLIVCGIGLIIWTSSIAQEEDVFKGELSKIYNEIKSPESMAFEKYGSPKVSLYTGTPQISVPLHTISGREFSLPFSLTYDASGVQVEQMSTWVGLSWNLDVGGRISRITNGLPDDYVTSGSSYPSMFNDPNVQQTAQGYIDNYASHIDNPQFGSVAEAIGYAQFLYDVNYNNIDTQYDYFKLTVPGLNATIVLEKNVGSGFTAKVLDNPRIKITYTTSGAPIYIDTWMVTNEDGTKYIFMDHEMTYRQNLSADEGVPMGDANTEYISAWLLTQIISKNNKDVFDITYVDEGYEPERSFTSSVGSVVTDIWDNVYDYSPPPMGNITNVVSRVKQRFPNEIFHNSKKLAVFNRGFRKDVDHSDKNQRLASIEFLDWNGYPIKSIEFDNGHYFNSDGLSNSNIFSTGKSYWDIRLKLDGLVIKGRDGIGYEKYYFEYFDPDGVPSRGSFDQDYLGYYNGAGNNTLYGKVEVGNFSFEGADREPNTVFGLKGTLNKIIYPTGGYTEFEYESHQEYRSYSNTYQKFVLSASLNSSNPTSYDLYTQAGIYCDDKYMSPYDPRIVIKTVTVLEEGDFNLTLTASNNNMEFYLADTMNGTVPYKSYCQFYNNPNPNVIGPLLFPVTQTIHLLPGKYRALLLLGNLNQDPSISASVSISKQVTTVNWNNVDIGGQRISRIRDYKSGGNLATERKFNYNNGNNESNGHVNYRPNLYSFRENDTQDGLKSQLVRYATFAKGSEPYVEYFSVSETLIGGLGIELGETKYNFFQGRKGSVPMRTPPYENWYFPSLSAGNISSKSVSRESDGKKLTKEQFSYYETVQRPIDIESLVVYVDNDNFQKTIFLKENIGLDGIEDTNDDYVNYHYLDSFDCTDSLIGCIVPGYFNSPQSYGYHSRLDSKYSPYKARVSKINGAYGGLDQYISESSFYDSNGNLISNVTSEENTEYDNNESSPKYLPRSKTVTDSKGNVIETTFTYPHDGAVNGSSAMVNKNMLSEVVVTESKMNPGQPEEQVIATIRKDYAVHGTVVVPDSITTVKGGNEHIGIGEFTYYPNGNIKIARRIDGPSTYYIWGYDSELSIAKITNFDDVAASPLQSLITACQTASDADDGTATAENALRTALEDLREALPDGALMTGYTHDPTIGVTSVMDARGYITYYEYDMFNRLKNIKDNELQLLSDYRYHYKGQN